MLKNVANQWAVITMYDVGTLLPSAGLTLADITIKISQINVGNTPPSASTTVTNNASKVEIGGGAYAVKLTQAETNCDSFIITASYTGGTNVGIPAHYQTQNDVGNIGSAALTQIENQVWNALRASHTTSGSFGEGVLIVPNSPISVTQINGSSDAAENMRKFFTDNVGYHLPYSSVGNNLNGITVAAGSSTITLDSSANSSNDDIYKNQYIRISDGTGKGQTRPITAYNSSTKVATVSPAWTVNPTSGSVYSIFGGAFVNHAGSSILTQIESQIWNASRSSYVTSGTFGSGVMLAPTAFSNVTMSFPGSSGPAANMGQAICMTYQRFFGQVVTNNAAKTLVVKSNDGLTTYSTQYWTTPSSDIISLGSAS